MRYRWWLGRTCSVGKGHLTSSICKEWYHSCRCQNSSRCSRRIWRWKAQWLHPPTKHRWSCTFSNPDLCVCKAILAMPKHGCDPSWWQDGRWLPRCDPQPCIAPSLQLLSLDVQTSSSHILCVVLQAWPQDGRFPLHRIEHQPPPYWWGCSFTHLLLYHGNGNLLGAQTSSTASYSQARQEYEAKQ